MKCDVCCVKNVYKLILGIVLTLENIIFGDKNVGKKPILFSTPFSSQQK
jgi:hypothetical protein